MISKYDTLSLEQLEEELKRLKKMQDEAYSDFIYWSIQKSIDKVEKRLNHGR